MTTLPHEATAPTPTLAQQLAAQNKARELINAERAKEGRHVLRTADFSDHGIFETGAGTCHVCGIASPLVLHIDTSEGVNAEASICADCVRRALRQRGQPQHAGGGHG